MWGVGSRAERPSIPCVWGSGILMQAIDTDIDTNIRIHVDIRKWGRHTCLRKWDRGILVC